MSQQYPQQPHPAPQAPPAGHSQDFGRKKGFFASLYDFGFTSFVTARVATALYAVLVILSTIGALIFILLTLAESSYFLGGLEKFFITIFILIGLPLWHLLMRITLEFYVAGIRTAENTSILVQVAAQNGGGYQGYVGGYPQQPEYFGQQPYSAPQQEPQDFAAQGYQSAGQPQPYPAPGAGYGSGADAGVTPGAEGTSSQSYAPNGGYSPAPGFDPGRGSDAGYGQGQGFGESNSSSPDSTDPNTPRKPLS